ncbi:MAG: ion channel [Flavobacterium sp.]
MKQVNLSRVKERFSLGSGKYKIPKANVILFVLTFIIVFVVPVFPYDHYFNYINYFLTLGTFLSATYILRGNHNLWVGVSIFLPTVVLIGKLADIEILTSIFRVIQFFFFLLIVGNLILRVSRISSVTLEVIIDSVVGYLLLGFAFTIIVAIVSIWIPDAYNIPFASGGQKHVLEDNVYYTFVTFTTTGYGDVLPVHPLSKSLAILISVMGQLYLAIIIAMLVGKYASVGKETL